MKRPLEGITVVGLEQVIAGPFCTRQLADLGARVIKIERPDGGDSARGYDRTVNGLSSHFVWVNRSKESLTLDVKHPGARPILEKLLQKADVFVQNLAPGAAERLGLGAAELRAKHPRLIWCGISGYGPAGPYAEKKAYDLLVQCEAGLLSVTGTPDHPAKAGIPVADRQQEGVGATLDITMLESLGEWMGFPAYFTAYGGTPPLRSGAHHATVVPYGPFRAGDGGTVFLAIQNEREFERFCAGVLLNSGLPTDARFSSGPARAQNREAMHAEIEKVFLKLKAQDILERLEKADIANAKLNTMQEFWDHPQLAARDRWREAGSPGGPVESMKPPFNLDGFEPRMDAIPAAGAHSAAILSELGFTSLEIEKLKSENIIQEASK